MTISPGKNYIDFSHVVKAPVEFWESRDDNGVVEQIRIIDQNNGEINLTFG